MEADLGRQLTEEEHEFVEAQLERKTIQAIQTDKRSAEQSTRLKKLQNFINHAKKIFTLAAQRNFPIFNL